MKKIVQVVSILVIASLFANLQAQCVQCDENNTNLGTYSSIIGMSNSITANSTNAFAGGYGSIADGDFSFAFGNRAKAEGLNAIAMGHSVYSTASNAMVFGTGMNTSNPLINNEQNSLMIGFNSTKPSLFVKGGGFNYTGKVGIGDVTDPQAKLHIKADDNENASILLEPTSVAKYARIEFGTQGNQISAKSDGDLTFYSSSDFVFSQANVGIGTTSPQSLLDVNGKTTTQELQITGGAGAGKVLTSDADGNASWEEMQIPESVWSENNGNVFVQNANVGIGTDNPSGKLHIDMGTDKPDFIWTSTDNTNSLASDIKFITDASDGNTVFSTFTGNYAPTYKWQCGMEDSKAIYTAMSLDLASWGTKLRLHGDLLCEQVEVMENVPNSDFVFEEGYKLMSLRELESYLKEHHHLPEIPSAAEFKENGYNMNDMDDLLLRKVEELTLYIIAQQKLINSLMKENEK